MIGDDRLFSGLFGTVVERMGVITMFDYFLRGGSVNFGVTGAFLPTNESAQVSEFLYTALAIQDTSINEIRCVPVNGPFRKQESIVNQTTPAKHSIRSLIATESV